MKKLNLLALVLVCFAASLSAQTCTIDTTHLASVYVYPPADSLQHITPAVYYDQTVQGKIKSSFDTTIVAFTFVVTVDSVNMDSIQGLPTGISWSRNPVVLKGGGFGCVEFYGTTTAPAGQYPLTAYGTAWGHASNSTLGIDTPVTYKGNLNNFSPFGGYYLVVDSAAPGVHVVVTGTSPLCSTGTGSASATATGGTIYTYSWSNGATTDTITDLTANTYTVTVTSGNLTATGSATITIPAAIVANLTQQHTNCDTAYITATVTGGTQPYTYFWSNRGALDDANTDYVLQDSTVYVTITDANSCQLVDTSTFICTGIANDGQMIGLQLYPDPASTVLHINVPQISSATVQIKIYDLTGQVVFSKTQNTTGALTTDIDVHSYAPGAYFVEVTNGTLTGRQKFVIER